MVSAGCGFWLSFPRILLGSGSIWLDVGWIWLGFGWIWLGFCIGFGLDFNFRLLLLGFLRIQSMD